MAMSEEGVVRHSIEGVSVKAENFLRFLTDLLLLLEQPSVIVMDNVSFHHGDVVNTIHEHDHDVLYTPPYSPFLNPIEDLFHLIKGTYLKREFFSPLCFFTSFHKVPEKYYGFLAPTEHIRRRLSPPSGLQGLCEAIEDAVLSLTAHHCKAAVKHTESFFETCFKKLHIHKDPATEAL